MRLASINQLLIRVQQINDALLRKGARHPETYELIRICFELLSRLRSDDINSKKIERMIQRKTHETN